MRVGMCVCGAYYAVYMYIIMCAYCFVVATTVKILSTLVGYTRVHEKVLLLFLQ